MNGSWIDRVAYCGGSNSTCKTPVVYSVANVSLMTPGVLTVKYALIIIQGWNKVK